MRRPTTYSSPAQALRATAQHYRRSLWDDSREQVAIWIEKDALAGLIEPVTDEWDAPLLVGKGYSSITYLYDFASRIAADAEWGARTHVYNFGDHDPSGHDIARAVTRGSAKRCSLSGTSRRRTIQWRRSTTWRRSSASP